MSQTASIAIAGGGIIGLSIAWRLAQRGFKVTVFEKGAIGAEASWAGAGMLAPGGEFDQPSELTALAIKSRRLYGGYVKELEQASGFAIDLQELGALDLAYTADELEKLEARAGRQEKLGIESKPVPVAKVKAFWPRVRCEGLAGARFYPGDGLVSPREVVLALCAACRRLGVRLEQNCQVLEVAGAAELRTANGVEKCDAVVIAAGAWSAEIKVDGGALPGATPVKGHLIGYQQPERTCTTLVRRGHTYLMQRLSGLLIAGTSSEHVGFDRTIDQGIVADIKERAAFVMPHLAETSPSEIWTGFRPASDELHMGRWQGTSVYLAYGHYRNGILLAPVTAERLADAIGADLA